jgi:xylan 1,4-beta-xylosidase
MNILRSFLLCIILLTTGNHVLSQYVCNPMNLSYRYRPETDEISRREAADPSVVFFKGSYYLFASKTGGYWWSDDLKHWELVETNQIPTESYAPAAIAIGDTLYFLASSSTTYYPFLKSVDPKGGKWEVVRDTFPFAMTDPAFFLDDDNHLYLYWGCSNNEPIYGVQLDMNKNFEPMSDPHPLTWARTMQHGWENPGDYNELTQQPPWLEGAWVTKHNGTYYLQYSGPGTEYKSYADAVYISGNPLGPYSPQKHNPFSLKPEGFACGAGHGSTFRDMHGNLWYIGTITISVKHVFERRLGLYPAFIDDDGVLSAYTGFGDYPFVIPDKKIESPEDISTKWMLLSYNKETQASSSLPGYESSNAVDEDIRTCWSAAKRQSGEWILTDLGNIYQVHAVQVNFADSESKLYERNGNCYYQYIIEHSTDGKTWEMLADKLDWEKDTPHDLIVPEKPVRTRYIRLTGKYVPDGYLALSGLRVFGQGYGEPPAQPTGLKASRHWQDKRKVTLQWTKDEDATGYNIRYGTHRDKLYLNHTVYNANEVTIRSLNAELPYYFSITGFNENGIGEPSPIIEAE